MTAVEFDAATATRAHARCALCHRIAKTDPGDPASQTPWVRARKGPMVYTAHRACWDTAGLPAPEAAAAA